MIRNYDDWRSINESKINPDQRVLLDLGLLNISDEQADFLDRFTQGTWSIDEETQIVDIEGNFICEDIDEIFDFFGTRFGRVTGNFNCSLHRLTSLEGAPKEVGGSFDCSYNKLTSLEGMPALIGGDFDYSNNHITTGKGRPGRVVGSIKCNNNRPE